MEKMKYNNIDHYISSFSGETAKRLTQIRKCIKETPPQSVETIIYNMPAFIQKKILVYFAAFKNHIGFYALPSGNKKFQLELSKYKTGKGSIQFPFSEELPLNLIGEITKFRLKEIEKK